MNCDFEKDRCLMVYKDREKFESYSGTNEFLRPYEMADDHSILAQMKQAADRIQKASPVSILTIGRDCGIEPAPASYLNKRHNGGLTVVWLNAHGDLNTPETSSSGHFHGKPLATLLGLGDPCLCRPMAQGYPLPAWPVSTCRCPSCKNCLTCSNVPGKSP